MVHYQIVFPIIAAYFIFVTYAEGGAKSGKTASYSALNQVEYPNFRSSTKNVWHQVEWTDMPGNEALQFVM
jgi:hypothetical protein